VPPLVPQHALYFTDPSDKLTIMVNVAITAGLVLAAALIVYQAWLFLATALHRHERRVTLGVLCAGIQLFLSGAALAQLVVVQLALP
jgi:sec-independent protein translocase protein TatC